MTKQDVVFITRSCFLGLDEVETVGSIYIELNSRWCVKLRNEMIKGYIDGIVLSVLSKQDAYGYEISKTVHDETSGQFDLKEGTLYPALKRMVASGYIEGYWVEQLGGPRRRLPHDPGRPHSAR
jgi:hypothetical protein